MKILKKAYSSYTVKFISIVLLTMLTSLTVKKYIISGILLFTLTIIMFVKSFKDPIFKKKNIPLKIVIYFFIAIYLIDSVILFGGNPDSTANSIRQEIAK